MLIKHFPWAVLFFINQVRNSHLAEVVKPNELDD
jgi:hypothetical protein